LCLFNETPGRIVKENHATQQFLIIAVKSQCDWSVSSVITSLDLLGARR
jgi:hypothetical protein